MPHRRSDDLWAPLSLLALGLLVPGLLWALVGDLIGLYVSPVALTLVSIVGYGLLAWFLIDRGTVDRTSFLLVSIIWPWPLLFGVLFLILVLNRGEQIPTARSRTSSAPSPRTGRGRSSATAQRSPPRASPSSPSRDATPSWFAPTTAFRIPRG